MSFMGKVFSHTTCVWSAWIVALVIHFLFKHQAPHSDNQNLHNVVPTLLFLFPQYLSLLSYAWSKLYFFFFLKHYTYLFPCLKVFYIAYTVLYIFI